MTGQRWLTLTLADCWWAWCIVARIPPVLPIGTVPVVLPDGTVR